MIECREIESQLSEDFIECFFEGSASQMVWSLLGQEKVSLEQLAQLKELLAEAEAAEPRQKSSKVKTVKRRRP